MTNDEKERLKEMLRESFSVPTEDADFLCGLLDRQPGEEASEWINSIDDCIGKVDWFYRKKCDKALLALDAIRKALNIEGYE